MPAVRAGIAYRGDITAAIVGLSVDSREVRLDQA